MGECMVAFKTGIETMFEATEENLYSKVHILERHLRHCYHVNKKQTRSILLSPQVWRAQTEVSQI